MSLFPPEVVAALEARAVAARGGLKDPNPCIRVYGFGPEGKRCASCAHLANVSFAKTYHKCRLRGVTANPKTDHRVRWPACGQYKEKNREQ